METNPYLSPAIVDDGGSAVNAGIWRDGDYLVVRRKRHSLPDRCPLCGEAADGRRCSVKLVKSRVSYVQNPNAATRIRIGLCHNHASRRRRGLLIRWLSVPLALAAAFLFLASGFFGHGAIELCGVGTIVLAGALGQFYGLRLALIPLAPVKIDDRFVWVQGACQEYLAEIPDIPQSQPQPAD